MQDQDKPGEARERLHAALDAFARITEQEDRVAALEQIGPLVGEAISEHRRVAHADPDGELVAALAAAQGDFPTIPKTKTATVTGKPGKAGYQYSYADLSDVLAAVRPVLSKH